MKPFSLCLHGRLVEYCRPAVMAIINVTPDSFFAGSRLADADAVKRRVEEFIAAGAQMLDIGAYSSRPGAEEIPAEAELERLHMGLNAIREAAPEIPVSVDTFRAEVARTAVESLGADIINDISGGDADPDMFATVAALHCPYVLMHMRGTPATMQSLTEYPDGVVTEVTVSLAEKMRRLHLMGVSDIIADPGLGFAKTVEQNYELLDAVGEMERLLEAPVLIGASRKSMVCRPLGISPAQALNGTTVINTVAILRGAAILRVHDPLEASQAVKLTSLLPSSHLS